MYGSLILEQEMSPVIGLVQKFHFSFDSAYSHMLILFMTAAECLESGFHKAAAIAAIHSAEDEFAIVIHRRNWFRLGRLVPFDFKHRRSQRGSTTTNFCKRIQVKYSWKRVHKVLRMHAGQV